MASVRSGGKQPVWKRAICLGLLDEAKGARPSGGDVIANSNNGGNEEGRKHRSITVISE